MVKNSPANAVAVGLIPGLERSLEEEKDKALQYSCLGNPMDRGAWRATVHGAARVRHNLVTKPGQRLKMENNNLRTSERRLPSF